MLDVRLSDCRMILQSSKSRTSYIELHFSRITQRYKWITDALIRYGMAADGPMDSAIWLSDPDGTAHSDGIGSVTAKQSIKDVDE